MAVSQDELNEFHLFAAQRLANGEAESMAELVAAWQDQRRQDQSVAALRESHNDAEAGRTIPAEEVFADTRKALGRPE